MNYLDKAKARVKSPKDLLDYVYKANQLFRFMNKDGGQLLGMKIKQIKPKNKQEWADYVINETNTLKKFAKTMKNNVSLGRFRYFNHLIELLTDKDIEDWCKVMVIEYQFKGYNNEMIVYNWLEQKGYAVYLSTNKDDLLGIDLHIVKDRLKGAVSVKSQGWYHNTSQKQKKVLFKQLQDTYIKKNLHAMYLIVVLDNGKVNVVRSWPK